MILSNTSTLPFSSYLKKNREGCGMTSIHNLLFNSLDKILNKADCLKFDRHFVIHEGSNFIRKSRKLSFKDMILFSLSIACKPIREEQHDFFITQIILLLPLHLFRHVLRFHHAFFNLFYTN